MKGPGRRRGAAALGACVCLLTAACLGPPERGAGSAAAAASPGAEASLRGRHAIGVQLGLHDWSVDSDTAPGGLTTQSRSDRFIGSVGYEHFLRDDLALGVTLGVLDSGSSTSAGGTGITSSSATVTPLLLGARYSPRALSIGTSLRPYVSAAVGPYFASATRSQVGPDVASQTVSDVALGLRAGTGVDW